VQRRETSLLDFADEHEKAKTSAKQMFLKGFGYDQSARKSEDTIRANPQGFGFDQCEEDVAKQPSK
jgi:hypothetical protein